MNKLLPEEKAKEVFNIFLEYFRQRRAGQAKVAAIICCGVLKDESGTDIEKMYWAYVIKELAQY